MMTEWNWMKMVLILWNLRNEMDREQFTRFFPTDSPCKWLLPVNRCIYYSLWWIDLWFRCPTPPRILEDLLGNYWNGGSRKRNTNYLQEMSIDLLSTPRKFMSMHCWKLNTKFKGQQPFIFMPRKLLAPCGSSCHCCCLRQRSLADKWFSKQ